MLPLQVVDAARKIGRFYLAKHNNDYAAAEKELNSLQITKIEVAETFSSASQTQPQITISITTGRPGILIGKRGQNIDNLTKFLSQERETKIRIIEDTEPLYQYLVPNQAFDREGMWDDPIP